jgi:hypothetical protein
MSVKASFESRILDWFTNAPYERVDLVNGLVKEIHKRRRLIAAEEGKRVATIAANPAPSIGVGVGTGGIKRRKRRTKKEMIASAQTPQAGDSDREEAFLAIPGPASGGGEY